MHCQQETNFFGSADRLPTQTPLLLDWRFALDLDTPQKHFDMLHQQQRGMAIIWQQRSSADDKRWVKIRPGDPAIPEILRAQEGKQDVFITPNTFDGWRVIRLLRSLRALYVDIDGSRDLSAVLDALLAQQLPGPSAVLHSGRGLHLYWFLEPLPPQALPVWQRCQDALIKALKPQGADPVAKDCTRLLRLAGTSNSKNGEEVLGHVFDNNRWSLRQLAFEILGTEGKGRKPELAQVRDIRAHRPNPDKAIHGSIYARWHMVFRDLVTISGHYGHRIPEGYRDKWLFLSGVALSWFTHPKGIEDEIIGLASKHTDLAQPEILHAMQPTLKRAMQAASGDKIEWQGQVVDPRYRFRRQTLYDWIGDLIPDSLLPKMRAIIPDDEGQRRKRARNAVQEKSRDRATEGRYETKYTKQGVRAANREKRSQARLLRAQGKSYRAIAADLGMNDKTIRNWCSG